MSVCVGGKNLNSELAFMPLCPFCYDNIKDRVVAEQNSVVAIQDNYPVTDGHLLIVRFARNI